MAFAANPEEGNLERVLKEMAAGRFVACYLLWGEVEFQIKEALDRMIDLAIAPADRDFLLFYLDGDRAGVRQLLAAAHASPLVPGRKVIVCRDTNLFQSKDTLPAVIDRIRELMMEHPVKAAEDFARAIPQTGYSLEDLIAGGWRSIGEAEGLKIMSPEAWQERANWLPEILELCASRQLSIPAGSEDGQELINSLLQGFPEDTHLILTALSVDRRKRLYKVIGEVGRIVYFPKAKRQSQQLQAIIEMGRDILAAGGKEMTPRAWEALGGRVDFDLQAARVALEKLVNYNSARKISEQEVEAVVGNYCEPTLFDLMTATWEKKLARALVIFNSLLYRMNYVQILSFFAKEVRLMLQAKDVQGALGGKYSPAMDYQRFQSDVYPGIKAETAPTAKAAGLLAGQHPYVIYNCLKNAARRPREELIMMLEELVEIDLAVKTSTQDPALLIERFIILATAGGASRPATKKR